MTFANAQSTRYRYQLAGVDRRWYESDPRVRRAAYTSLAPGHYLLHVQSAASRGAWSEPGVTFAIHILPPWWATWWSRALYGILATLAFGYLYRHRLLKIDEQWQIRMEARISERTRIARDLHDTLLQGLLSASLQLEVAREELAPGSMAIPRIERVFRQLRQMIDESRQTVRGLRLPQTPQEELDEAINCLLTEMGRSISISFQMHVKGERKVLKAAVRTELYWICKEALSNAARHSQASIVHTTLDFSSNRLLMTIEDNGRGMPAELIASGRTNHWGLKGIDERAARVGATVQIHSVMNGGTAVVVTIPSRDAYLTGSPRWN
jgi:signal transduction histidine kinase